MSDLRFDDKVVVVTGAGGGLGRQYALMFGCRGASVVVNDLGGSGDGRGSSTRPADSVVQEIIASGGKAVVDYNSVEDGDRIIDTAIKSFGRIDVLVNNAGILRDKSFLKMADDDWDLVLKVHLKGSYSCCKAAWPYFRKQGFGKVIMTASGAGLYGNFGQSNYSSAKMGLIGLSNTLAREGMKYNISSNVVVPMAASRLTENILPPDMFERLKPEHVAPLVVWLCHESCDETGGIFEGFAGNFARYRLDRSIGSVIPVKDLSPEKLRDTWDAVNDFTDSIQPSSNEELMSTALEILQQHPTQTAEQKQHIDLGTALKWRSPTYSFSYSQKEVVLYALGLGLSVEDPENLRYLYEGHPEFRVLPTYGCIIAQDALMKSGAFLGGIPGLSFSLEKVLHGEQYMRLYQPIPESATVLTTLYVADVLDKTSGAVVVLNAQCELESGEKLLDAQFTLFIVGSGGFGGNRHSDKLQPLANMPYAPADRILYFPTTKNQAAIYRLSGDLNPLHIDPNFAQLGGFNEPILHGLSTMGSAVTSIIRACKCTSITELKLRFAKTVIPGDELKTEIWEEDDRILFQTRIKESNDLCLTGGYIKLENSSRYSAQSKL